jgi:hypothetical protein
MQAKLSSLSKINSPQISELLVHASCAAVESLRIIYSLPRPTSCCETVTKHFSRSAFTSLETSDNALLLLAVLPRDCAKPRGGNRILGAILQNGIRSNFFATYKSSCTIILHLNTPSYELKSAANMWEVQPGDRRRPVSASYRARGDADPSCYVLTSV